MRLIGAVLLICMVMGLCTGSVAPAQNTAAHNTTSLQSGGTWLNEKLNLDSPSLLDRFRVYQGDSSVQEENTSGGDGFEEAMRDAFEGAAPSFSGACTQMTGYDIRTFDLVTDDDIADPSHAGKEKGVKVTILYDSSETTHDTLWGHETDATTVARALYTSDAGARIGTLAIVFRYEEAGAYRLKLTLDAADAEKFAGAWEEGTFIRKADWSKADINAEEIAPYENPGKILAPARAASAGADSTPAAVATGKEAFKTELYSSTVLLTSASADIASGAKAEEFDRTAASAEALIDTSDAVRTHVGGLRIDRDLEPARKEYLLGVDEYRKAGSYLWNGSRQTRGDEFEAAQNHLKEGEQHINRAFEMLGMETLDSRSYTRPPCDPFPDALAPGEHFIYRDDQGANDISVIVDAYETKTGYMIEDNGSFERVNAEYGDKFLYVVLQATHLGFRGNGSEEITTPPADAFTLILDGEEYAHSTPERYVRELGEPYAATTLERKEVCEGFLIFVIPATADPAEGYLRFDPGTGRQPVWKLRK